MVVAFRSPARAQTTPTCYESADRVVNGTPSEDDLARLLNCKAERGPAYAAYLQRLSPVSDTLVLRGPFEDAGLLRDASVFEALHTIAGNPGAAAPARVYSLIGIIYHEAGSTSLSYGEITSVGPAGTCPIGTLGGVEQFVKPGAPLPADHLEQSRSLASRLAEDATVPPTVRSAARCVLTATGGIAEQPSTASQAINWSAVELTYVCGKTFRVRNSNLRRVPVRFEIEGTGYVGDIILPRNGNRTRGYSEITFGVPVKGTVRFVDKGVIRKRAANTSRTCG